MLPPCYLSGPNYGGGNKDNLQKIPVHVLLHTVPPSLQQANTNPHLRWRFLDTQATLGQSLLGSLLLSPGSWCTQCKEIEESNRMGKTRDFLKKIRDPKGTFHAKMGSIKDRNGMDLTETEDIKKRWQEYTEQL